MEIEMEMAQH